MSSDPLGHGQGPAQRRPALRSTASSCRRTAAGASTGGGGGYVALDLVWYSVLALVVTRVRRAFVAGPWQRRLERLTGSMMVALGRGRARIARGLRRRRDLAREPRVVLDQLPVRAQRAAADSRGGAGQHERRHGAAADACRLRVAAARARSAARRRRGCRPAAARAAARRRPSSQCAARDPRRLGRVLDPRGDGRARPAPSRRAAARRCGSRAPARRASRAARRWRARRAATSPRRRRRAPRIRERVEVGRHVRRSGQPRCTPPRPPVAMNRMPAARQTASVPPDGRRADCALHDARPRGRAGRPCAPRVEARELVVVEADDDLAVEHADRGRNGAARRAPRARRRARPRCPRPAGSRARRASSRARRRRGPLERVAHLCRRSGSRHRPHPRAAARRRVQPELHPADEVARGERVAGSRRIDDLGGRAGYSTPSTVTPAAPRLTTHVVASGPNDLLLPLGREDDVRCDRPDAVAEAHRRSGSTSRGRPIRARPGRVRARRRARRADASARAAGQ